MAKRFIVRTATPQTGADGLGLTTAAGFLAMLAAAALILLTKRVSDLEDRRDDYEENRNLADRQ